MIYLASPYTHPDKEVMHVRFFEAEHALFLALRDCHWVYSPIVHCHELARKHKLPTSHTYWLAYDTEFLRLSSELWTLYIPGWDTSKGVTYERKLAQTLGIPRRFMFVPDVGANHFSLEDDDLEP